MEGGRLFLFREKKNNLINTYLITSLLWLLLWCWWWSNQMQIQIKWVKEVTKSRKEVKYKLPFGTKDHFYGRKKKGNHKKRFQKENDVCSLLCRVRMAYTLTHRTSFDPNWPQIVDHHFFSWFSKGLFSLLLMMRDVILLLERKEGNQYHLIAWSSDWRLHFLPFRRSTVRKDICLSVSSRNVMNDD